MLAVDPDPKRLASLNAGRVPFVETGLDALVAKGIASGRLAFSGDPETAAAFSSMHFLAVGTPSAADGSTDESQLITAAHAIGRGAVGDVVIVVKSTAPVGAAERVIDEVRHELSQRGVAFQAEVVVNPEFLRAGSAVKEGVECLKKERGESTVHRLPMNLCSRQVRSGHELHFMDCTTVNLT